MPFTQADKCRYTNSDFTDQPDATVSGFYDAYPTPSNGYYPGGYDGEQFASDSQGVSVGVIVGASVGGSIGAIAIVTALIFLIRASRRRRRAMANVAIAPNVPLKEHSFEDVALMSAAKLYVRAGHMNGTVDTDY